MRICIEWGSGVTITKYAKYVFGGLRRLSICFLNTKFVLRKFTPSFIFV